MDDIAATLEHLSMSRERRIKKISQWAKENPEGFYKHIEKVVKRIPQKDFNNFRELVMAMIKKAPQQESWSHYKELLSENVDGYFVFLKIRLTDKGYFEAAERAGLAKTRINKICKKQAEIIFLPSYISTPPEKHNIPNDSTTKAIRRATTQDYENGKITAIEREGNKRKKIARIETEITLNAEKLQALGYNNPSPLDFYTILTCFAIQSAGNEATSINAIYRTMTGKRGDEAPSEELEKDISEALIKGMATIIAINPEGIRKAYAKELKKNDSIKPLLPIEIEPARINGTRVDRGIIFKGKSPLVSVAEIKGGQFLTYDTALLNVPYNMSRQNILIAPYLLWHIEDTRTGRLQKTINIDNFMQEIQYNGTRKRLVGYIVQCFTYWQKVKYISKFTTEKDGRGKATRITFTLPKKTKRLEEGY